MYWLVLMIWNCAEIQGKTRASQERDPAAPRGHESICHSNCPGKVRWIEVIQVKRSQLILNDFIATNM